MVPRIGYSLVKEIAGKQNSWYNLVNVMTGDKHRLLRTQKRGFSLGRKAEKASQRK